jgi:hypothetical protein
MIMFDWSALMALAASQPTFIMVNYTPLLVSDGDQNKLM